MIIVHLLTPLIPHHHPQPFYPAYRSKRYGSLSSSIPLRSPGPPTPARPGMPSSSCSPVAGIPGFAGARLPDDPEKPPEGIRIGRHPGPEDLSYPIAGKALCSRSASRGPRFRLPSGAKRRRWQPCAVPGQARAAATGDAGVTTTSPWAWSASVSPLQAWSALESPLRGSAAAVPPPGAWSALESPPLVWSAPAPLLAGQGPHR